MRCLAGKRCATFVSLVRASRGHAGRTPAAAGSRGGRRFGWRTTRGRLAQLGERRVRNAEGRSSILLPSTNFHHPLKRRPVPASSAFFTYTTVHILAPPATHGHSEPRAHTAPEKGIKRSSRGRLAPITRSTTLTLTMRCGDYND